ncbi:type II secretion system protein [Cysteiniphilum halobium]|uniref:type II secretion system protein n=1 Tax=Cysteiniphilum halobium TaxID=2219059 RepID=UPI000E650ED5|nr:hypothetical protein [Cysteiniphilum halobium]
MNHRGYRQGFALFETMLALVIIAMMIVVASHYYNRISQLQEANKTAMDIKEIFAATFAYQQQTSQWPNDISSIIHQGFLPPNLANNIFGDAYTLQANLDKQYIEISSCFSSMGLAAKIITMLPAANISSDCTNKGYVKVTSRVSFTKDQGMTHIRVIDSTDPNSFDIKKPDCKSDTTAHILILPVTSEEQFQTQDSGNTWHINATGEASTYQALAYVYCATNTNGDAA